MAGNGMGGQLKNGYFNNHTGLFEEVGRRCKGVGGLHQLCHVPPDDLEWIPSCSEPQLPYL